MSKAGRKVRKWHYRRIEEEFGESPERIIERMFLYDGLPITVMAAELGISYGEMHEWIRDLNLSRVPITPRRSHRAKERLRREYETDPVQLICSERIMGKSYREIRDEYGVSAGFVAACLREGAPWIIGDRDLPVTVRPPRLSDEERCRRSERCREHNARMKEDCRGWFADMHLYH